MMTTNKYLQVAKEAKFDEYFTRYEDIDKELSHYKSQFENKIIYCNCDDYHKSQFFVYFIKNFNKLKIKQLITTCYDSNRTQVDMFSEIVTENINKAYLSIINEVEDTNLDLIYTNPKNIFSVLQGDGDFSSSECIDLLKISDIVVTNPPFSLFNNYIKLLMAYDKKFLILGNMSAITNETIFNYIKDGKLFTGYKSFGGGMNFYMPLFDKDLSKTYRLSDARMSIEEGKTIKNIMGVIWYTNLDKTDNIPDWIPMLKTKYSLEKYPKYDGYDIINVNRVEEIPMDYFGLMGVPITFLGKHNNKEFEIVGLANPTKHYGIECSTKINNKNLYYRLIIRRKI